MQTTIRLKPSELNPEFLEKVKNLTVNKTDQEVDIQVIVKTVSDKIRSETQAAANLRIEKAASKLAKEKNGISFTPAEFEALTDSLR